MWPKRKELAEYRADAFTGTRLPTLATLKRRILRNELPGEKQGGRYYVLVGPDGEPMARATTIDRKADQLLTSWLEDMPHGSAAQPKRVPQGR
jgi:hypothetical protein